VWEDLERGVPTIMALALATCASASRLDAPEVGLADLTEESQALLAAARTHGLLSVRCDPSAFDPSQRMLFVCAERPEGQRLEFRSTDARQNARFLEAMRQLCVRGLALHQMQNEFSLTPAGFRLADLVEDSAIAGLLDLGREAL
jgi:hypothetical protein